MSPPWNHGCSQLSAHSSFAKSAATVGRVPARCAKPSGRSLELRSDARPRGMAVLRYVVSGGGLRPTTEQLLCRQNSAYRPGCQLKFLAEHNDCSRSLLAYSLGDGSLCRRYLVSATKRQHHFDD